MLRNHCCRAATCVGILMAYLAGYTANAANDLVYPDACVSPDAQGVIPLAQGIGMRFLVSDRDAAASINAPTTLYCRYEVVGARGLIDFQFIWSTEPGPSATVSGFNPLCEYGPKVLRGIGTTEVYVGGGVRGRKATVRVLPVGGVSLKWDEIESAVADFAEYTLDRIRPLATTCDGYVADAAEQKEMRRRGSATSEEPNKDAPVIDVNKIPDSPSFTNEQPMAAEPECKMVSVDNSTALYDTRGLGGGSGEQCLCGLEIADPSRCR